MDNLPNCVAEQQLQEEEQRQATLDYLAAMAEDEKREMSTQYINEVFRHNAAMIAFEDDIYISKIERDESDPQNVKVTVRLARMEENLHWLQEAQHHVDSAKLIQTIWEIDRAEMYLGDREMVFAGVDLSHPDVAFIYTEDL